MADVEASSEAVEPQSRHIVYCGGTPSSPGEIHSPVYIVCPPPPTS